jgi:hypothetical protein
MKDVNSIPQSQTGEHSLAGPAVGGDVGGWAPEDCIWVDARGETKRGGGVIGRHELTLAGVL